MKDSSRFLGRKKGGWKDHKVWFGPRKTQGNKPSKKVLIKGTRGEIYLDRNSPLATEMLVQQLEEREAGKAVDEKGRTVADRIAWKRFLSGFCVAVFAWTAKADTELTPPGSPVLGPTLSCLEPSKDANGNALGIQSGGLDNSLLGCYFNIRVGSIVFYEGWLQPKSGAGGTKHLIHQHLPTYTSSFPVNVACVCYNRMGWGAPDKKRVTIMLVSENGR